MKYIRFFLCLLFCYSVKATLQNEGGKLKVYFFKYAFISLILRLLQKGESKGESSQYLYSICALLWKRENLKTSSFCTLLLVYCNLIWVLIEAFFQNYIIRFHCKLLFPLLQSGAQIEYEYWLLSPYFLLFEVALIWEK